MAEITTEYDAKVNLTVAEEALSKGKRENLSKSDIKKLEKHVKDAKAILAGIQKALKASRKN